MWLTGADVTGVAPDRRARRGLARSFQRNNLFADLTVHTKTSPSPAPSRSASPMSRGRRSHATATFTSRPRPGPSRSVSGTFWDTEVRRLSYGTQRQLEVALALAPEPKVLLLDEPTAGMSPEETSAMQAMIAALPASLTLLVIEHDMEVVFGVAERITVLDGGRVLMQGDPREVRDSDAVRNRYLGTP